MKTLFPAPLLSLCVFVVWLLLVGSIEPGHLLLATLQAVLLPQIAQRLRHGPAGIHRPWVALRLFLVVLWDIVVSNIQVAKLILGREANIHPGFLWLPLEVRNPHAIATLAGIITMTPGTLSAEVSADNRYLLVHCFSLDDEAGTIAQIKQRYEAPLKEIFE
ncbi:MAG: Na+/H+ antiporter subunit E [Lysobacterales bacterium]|jgi:multicomponent K+:H+ antiporter subunit E